MSTPTAHTHNPIQVEFTELRKSSNGHRETKLKHIETMCDCTPELWHLHGHQQMEFARILEEEAAR